MPGNILAPGTAAAFIKLKFRRWGMFGGFIECRALGLRRRAQNRECKYEPQPRCGGTTFSYPSEKLCKQMEWEQSPSGDVAKDIATLFREGPYAGENAAMRSRSCEPYLRLTATRRRQQAGCNVQAPSSTNQAAALSHPGFVAHRDYDIKIDVGVHTSCIRKSRTNPDEPGISRGSTVSAKGQLG